MNPPPIPSEIDVSDRDSRFVTTQSHAAADPFRLLVEAVKDYAIFMLDPAGNVSSWNPGAEKSKGYKSEEIIGRHVSCFYSAEDVKNGRPEQGLQTALSEGRFEEEGLRLRKDGTLFWAIATITNIHDSFGQHVGFAIVIRDITERKQSEEMLRLCDRAIESLVQGFCITDPKLPDNPIVYANKSFLRITGYAQEEVIGRNCRFLQGPKTAPESIAHMRNALCENIPCIAVLENYRKDGTTFWNDLSISPIRDNLGNVVHYVGVITDISPMKEMEHQFHQAQKMEAVGQLAGGVAHDFNNLLTIISGYSELLLETMSNDDFNRDAVKAIIDAGTRAAGLTRQLLYFSRRAVLETRILDLNEIVTETEKLLRRTIGENIQFTSVLDPTILRTLIDATQLSQVIMNLAINARDAMPEGGKLTIETSNATLDELYASLHLDCPPGPYVKLAVSDTGCGMSPEVKAHIYEPFFTTKSPGKGTGIGLATVFGIVKQCGGSIDLYSEPGIGTTFKIYLPAVFEKSSAVPNPTIFTTVKGGTETILLVEDEDAVRAIAKLALQTRGYEVIEADSGKKALQILENHQGQIDILVTDVVMPGMSGRVLAETLGEKYSALKVLYVSGYTDDSVIRHGILQVDVSFLQKPYTPIALARKVREVLDKR